MNKINLLLSSTYAAIVSSVFVVAVTVYAELSPPLKDWLKNITGHHWTTKSLFTALIFIIAFLIFSVIKKKESGVKLWLIWLLVTVLLGSVTITAFFAGHHFQIW